LVLYYIITNKESLENLLESTSKSEIFNKHLHYLGVKLQQDSQLWDSLKQIVKSPVELETEVVIKLKSLGVIALEGNQAIVSCQLYQDYFINFFGE
ncbi:MAG: AAA-like domain-containing protein, partial [Rhizonema sp. PD37]|nr:AAA-like domain-containing protein [Rhizonema sp. PD37]